MSDGVTYKPCDRARHGLVPHDPHDNPDGTRCIGIPEGDSREWTEPKEEQ